MGKIRILKGLTHEEWLRERSKGIGSSEVGVIMGASPYDTPYELYNRKVGIAGPVEENEAMIMGHIYEESVAQKFALATGNHIVKASAGDWIAYDPDCDFMRVSPDRIYFEPGMPHTKANRRIVECKTTAKDVDEQHVPQYWICQLQYQMGVMGIKRGAIAWTSTAFRLHSGYQYFDFDPVMFEQIRMKVTSFWYDNILKGVAPAFSTVGDVNAHYPNTLKGTTVTASDEVAKKCDEIKALRVEMERLKACADDLEMDLKKAMGEYETLIDGTGQKLATWRTTEGRSSLDQKKLKDEHPEIFDQYTKKGSPFRTFKVL